MEANDLSALCEPQTFFYGSDHETQFIRYFKSKSTRRTVFAIIHGGYWKKKYGVDTSGIGSLVPFLQSRGYGVCLVEYRRVGHEGGGWPGTNDDIANAMKKLEDVLQNEKEISSAEHSDSDSTQQKVILLGHSAGGTLALWIACKSSMLGDIVPITLCVAVAPIGNLEEGSRRRLSDDGDAIDLYMGCVPIGTSNLGTEICPYSMASPHRLLPLKVPTLLTIGTADVDVPPDMLITFHKDSVKAHKLLRIEVEKGSVCEEDDKSIAPHVTPVPDPNSMTRIVCAEPTLLLIESADHYKILDASETAWLELFASIENQLQLQVQL